MLLSLESLAAAGTTQQHQNTICIYEYKNKSIPANFTLAAAGHVAGQELTPITPFISSYILIVTKETRGHLQTPGLLQRIGPTETAQSLQRIAP